jgi:hypothetical protein
MKKLTALLLACMTFVCVAVSCGNNGKEVPESKSAADREESTEAASVMTAPKLKEAHERAMDNMRKAADENRIDSPSVTINPRINEAREKALDNMREKIGDVSDYGNGQLSNTDEMTEDAKAVVTQFVKAMCDVDAEAMAETMYPTKMLEGMKACGQYDDFAESVASDDKYTFSGVYVKFCVKMKENELALAQSYMNYFAKEYGLGDNEYRVTDGYSFMAELHSSDDDASVLDAESLLIVNIENEGLKMIPISLDDLTK